MAKTEILIISDTHGKGDLAERAVALTRPHLTIFCGDGLRDLAFRPALLPLYAVRGNCDYFTVPDIGETEETLTLTIDGLKLLITHGHRYGVKSGLGALITKAIQENTDAVIFGHTHEPLELTLLPEHASSRFGISLNKPLYLFNPGSLGYAPHSFGTLTIKDGVPLFGHGRLEH
ncbi:MAG: metallophosphoesterase family protein [Clostridia bacterium]|nr:metallophosphoesterase family protein [Clostridia bacterium]